MDDNRGWLLGQAVCRVQGRPVDFSFCGGGAGAAASELPTVKAVRVASPSESSLPLPPPAPLSLPLGENWGSPAGSAEYSASTTMRRCNLVGRIGKMRWALPSASGTGLCGTYSADESVYDGSGTTNTCWVSCIADTRTPWIPISGERVGVGLWLAKNHKYCHTRSGPTLCVTTFGGFGG